MNREAQLDYLIAYLESERKDSQEELSELKTIDEKIRRFRSLCNVRAPLSVSDSFLKVQEAFLTAWNGERETISIKDLQPIQEQLYLWQGDITTLALDGIVNAANSELLGCKIPNHNCIDNIIHTRAGVELRIACHELMEAQGRKEAVGKAKITKAYHLPSRYVIHTVGPYIDERGVSPLKEGLLASCYRASLALADEYGLTSLAFCCISTGEFNFPNKRAAEIAVETVKKYLTETNSDIQVLFNVFKDEDLHIYRSLLTELIS